MKGYPDGGGFASILHMYTQLPRERVIADLRQTLERQNNGPIPDDRLLLIERFGMTCMIDTLYVMMAPNITVEEPLSDPFGDPDPDEDSNGKEK